MCISLIAVEGQQRTRHFRSWCKQEPVLPPLALDEYETQLVAEPHGRLLLAMFDEIRQLHIRDMVEVESLVDLIVPSRSLLSLFFFKRFWEAFLQKGFTERYFQSHPYVSILP